MLFARSGVLGTALVLACAPQGAFPGCPVEGEAVSPSVRSMNRLKNRATAPAPEDVDSTVTLEALLAPGDDRERWSERRAASIIGYVRFVGVGGVETVNCRARTPDHRDTHIELIPDSGEGAVELPVIVEVTPGWRIRVGDEWSSDALRVAYLNRRVRVTGWLFFDAEHSREAENTAPGRPGNWRGTAWEIHPVTGIELVPPDPRPFVN